MKADHANGFGFCRSRLSTWCSVCVVVSSSLRSRPWPPSSTATSRSAASATYVIHPALKERYFDSMTPSDMLAGPSPPSCYQLPQAKVRPHQPAATEEEAEIDDSFFSHTTRDAASGFWHSGRWAGAEERLREKRAWIFVSILLGSIRGSGNAGSVA